MVWRRVKKVSEYRDVSGIVRWLRDILLGRKHIIHPRFPKYSSPRTIPDPDVVRTLNYKYSDQYYCNRSYNRNSLPPVVAPIAEGPPLALPKTDIPYPGGLKPDEVKFESLPKPGTPWWWDGHFYYDSEPGMCKKLPVTTKKKC